MVPLDQVAAPLRARYGSGAEAVALAAVADMVGRHPAPGRSWALADAATAASAPGNSSANTTSAAGSSSNRSTTAASAASAAADVSGCLASLALGAATPRARQEQRLCAACGQTALQQCSGCRRAFYCSEKCQLGHWRQHKRECRKMQAELMSA